jgi:apolipoprotein N-acyltransferase
MERIHELSEAREIKKSVNIAICFLVFSSLYLAFSFWYTLRNVQIGNWTQVVLGAIFLAMGVLGVFRAILSIQLTLRRLLD